MGGNQSFLSLAHRPGRFSCRALSLVVIGCLVVTQFVRSYFEIDLVNQSLHRFRSGTPRFEDERANNWTEIAPPKIDPNAKVKFTKWIVPHPDLNPGPRGKAAFPGWQILVPPGYMAANTAKGNKKCTECLEYVDHLRSNLTEDWTAFEETVRHARSVLFAIQNHARQIILSSNLDLLENALQKLLVDTKPDGAVGLEYIGPNLTLDSYHFHHRPSLETADSTCRYRIRKQLRPLMTAGIQCRSKKRLGIAETITMDEQSPPVFTSGPKFIFGRLEDIVFEYDAFWAIFATLFNSRDEVEVWGLWAQRLMQEIDAEVGIVVLPCSKGVSIDVSTEKPSAKIQAVYSTVSSWSCPSDFDLSACSLALAELLAQQGHVTDKATRALNFWLVELQKSYQMPSRQPFSGPHQRRDKTDAMEGCVIPSPALVVEGGTANLSLYKSPQKLFPKIEKMCKMYPKESGVTDPFQLFTLDPVRSKTKDIALVIIIGFSDLYVNIVFVDELYKFYFRHVIFCGPDADVITKMYAKLERPITFIEVAYTAGVVPQECLMRAIMMNYGVRGYIEIADDLILNSWTLASLPRDKFWFQSDLRVANQHQSSIPDIALDKNWPPWTQQDEIWGRKPFTISWAHLLELRSAETNSNDASRYIVDSFFRSLEENSGGADLFFYSPSDIFYVPTCYRREWIFLSNIFVSHKVHLELAVPTVMAGIDKVFNIVRLQGDYLWYSDRSLYRRRYNASSNFLHPYKLGKMIRQKNHAPFLCFQVLPHIVDDLVKR